MFTKRMKSICTTLVLLFCALATFASECFVYFGTYTGEKSRGIYGARLNSDTGKLSKPELVAEIQNPSFLAVHPSKKFLYALGEVNDTTGKSGGRISAFSLDAEDGKLIPLNKQMSGGSGPCHVSVDATGECLLVANYGSGSIAAFPIHADGSLGEASASIQHAGSSVNPQRQTGPHAHAIIPSPDNRFALTADLGLDKVLAYRLDAATGKLTTNNPPFATVLPGSGPRHIVFSTDGKFVYVINEMKLTVTVFAYDAKTAAMTEVQTVSTLPANYSYTDKDSCAEIAMHPCGKFLYGSNRGHNSIAVFVVDTKTGKVKLVQNESTQGKTPRHFAIDPSGRWLFAENQNSDSIAVFAIDFATGKIKPTGQTITLGSPVCAVFVKPK